VELPTDLSHRNSARASAVASGVGATVAAVSLSCLLQVELALSDWYPVKAAVICAIAMLIAISRVSEYHEFARLGPANHVTTARLVLAGLVAGLIGEPTRPIVATAATVASAVAAILDGVDGWLARRTRFSSRFGARFDMEVDALMILALSILVWTHGKAGAWVLLSGLLRYLFVSIGWLLPWLRRPLPASRRRQTICVVQVVGLILAIAPVVPPPESTWVAAVVLVTLCCSFLVDVVWLGRQKANL
jgi:phosphatidylglycerophosphate synthase